MLLAAAACSGDGGRPQPDLILVSIDTTRADRLPFYGAARDTGGDPGQPFNPAWLAAQGTVFETCWSAAGQTLPSLANFWTGRPPLEHGAISNMVPFLLPSRLQQLREKCFTAAHALLANASLGPGCGLERGFDSYGLMVKQNEQNLPRAMLERTAAAVAGRERLLAWAHFMAPHQPYAPPEELVRRYGGGRSAPADNEFLYGLHRAGAVDDALREDVIALYDAEIRLASSYVQEFLAGLDAQYRAAGRGGLLENAVVVFFSDHGEDLADHQAYFMHAKSLYSGVIHVPLVVAGPGWKAGERDARPLSLGDVLPLVLDGAEPPPGPHVAAWRANFYAIRDGRWTLVHNPADDPAGPREPPQDAAFRYPVCGLYDRAADPRELRDVSREHPEEVARLLGALNQWYDGLELLDSLVGVTDPRVLEQLGYAGSGGDEQRVHPLPPPR